MNKLDNGGESTEITDMGSPLSAFLMKKKRAKDQKAKNNDNFTLMKGDEMHQCDLVISPQIQMKKRRGTH